MAELTLQEQYTQEIGKLPNNKKNDLERIQAKLDAFRAGDAVDSTPDDDGNETPEEGMITKTPDEEPTPDEEVSEKKAEELAMQATKTATQAEEKKVELKQTPEAKEHNTLLKIQAFHGISNEELYNDDILTKKYKLTEKEIATIRTYTSQAEKDIDLNLNYHEMPDYIQVIFNKYGFNGETLKSKEKITALITGGKEPTEAQELEIHQLVAYYGELRAEAMKEDLILENPALHNPDMKPAK